MNRLNPIISAFLMMLILSCGGGSGSNDSTPPPSSGDPWLIPVDQVVDGGPGKDGIPSIDSPQFITTQSATNLVDNELVIGIILNGQPIAFPHAIMNWHEVSNLASGSDNKVLSYCPLTGTADLWSPPTSSSNKSFGVSGLLYNSNLILYDRETDSNWSQMLAQSVNGPLISSLATKHKVIETTWATWIQMFPNTQVLSRETGFSRDYSAYPYGSYRTDSNLLFPVANTDTRLHVKERVLGIQNSQINKVFVLEDFNSNIQVIEESAGSFDYVVVGSSQLNFAIAFESRLTDGTLLRFTAVRDSLPVIMLDNEGTQWDIFGNGVSGPRAGETLSLASDFIAFWFAWSAFFPQPEIHSF